MTESARREEAFRSALGRLPIAVVVVDGKKILNAYNQRAVSLFERESLSGDLLDARPTHPLAEFIQALATDDSSVDDHTIAFPSGRKYRVEASRRSEKGMDRWLVLLISPASDASGIDAFAFTPREREVAELVLRGVSPQAICDTLGISRDTLKTHMSRLFEKTETHNRAEFIAKVLRTGD